ncbi:MAG: S8 family serine peptidase [Anaerolineae bacterium]|jgi:subtilisin family serine protease
MQPRASLGLSLTILLLLALLPAIVLAGRPAQQAQVHPEVWETLQDGGETQVLLVLRQQADLSAAAVMATKEAKGRYVYETLRAVAEESQPDLRAMLDARKARYQPFYLVNAISVRANEELVRSLAARYEVDRILPNPQVVGVPNVPVQLSGSRVPQGIQENLRRVNADDVWALGHTGQGIVVAGQDTGYDWDHAALINQYRGWDGDTADHNYHWHDAIHSGGGICGPDSAEPCDDHGHGTHTMGIAVGDDGAGNQIGMAPGAQWIGCRNMDRGVGTPTTYIECFEFFLAPYPLGGDPLLGGEPSLAPHVVNNSWACPPSEGCNSAAIALMEDAVAALRQAGIVVVASAGNYGPTCGSVKYPPAIYPQSFSIGNYDHGRDRINDGSSRGPATYGEATYTKPDLSAPGTGIYSSIPDWNEDEVPDYGLMTGTSMSAPHVAGAVALLLSSAPGYSGRVDTLEYLLTRSAEPMTTTQTCGGDGLADVPNNTWGWGILDVLAAVRSSPAGTLQGRVSDADSQAPIAGAQVTASLGSGLERPALPTNPSGQYTLTLPAGTYDVTTQAEGYVSQTITNVIVLSSANTLQDYSLRPLERLYLPLVAKIR